LANVRVEIKCQVCGGDGKVWTNTEPATSSGHYISCGRCGGSGAVDQTPFGSHHQIFAPGLQELELIVRCTGPVKLKV